MAARVVTFAVDAALFGVMCLLDGSDQSILALVCPSGSGSTPSLSTAAEGSSTIQVAPIPNYMTCTRMQLPMPGFRVIAEQRLHGSYDPSISWMARERWRRSSRPRGNSAGSAVHATPWSQSQIGRGRHLRRL